MFFPRGLYLAFLHLKRFPKNGFNSYDSILVFHLVFPFHIFLRISERDLTLVRLCERGRAGQSLHQEILHLSLGGFCYSHHHRHHHQQHHHHHHQFRNHHPRQLMALEIFLESIKSSPVSLPLTISPVDREAQFVGIRKIQLAILTI